MDEKVMDFIRGCFNWGNVLPSIPIRLIDGFILHFPNFAKLFFDLLFVYDSNKKFIWHVFRVYMYIFFILYVVTFLVSFTVLFMEFESLIPYVELLVWIYRFWSFPISKFVFVVKYLFIVPLKIFILISKIISYIIAELFRGRGNAECMERSDLGKSPEYGRVSDLSSAEWDLNCVGNRVSKSAEVTSFTNSLRSAGHIASTMLDQNEDARTPFRKYYSDHIARIRHIDNTKWCPSFLERERWNNRK